MSEDAHDKEEAFAHLLRPTNAVVPKSAEEGGTIT
jgi:hypothetical protein